MTTLLMLRVLPMPPPPAGDIVDNRGSRENSPPCADLGLGVRKNPMDVDGGSTRPWHEIVLAALKENDVKLVTYVPDRVLTTLIECLHADPYFKTFPSAREEEAVGILTGACLPRPSRPQGPIHG